MEAIERKTVITIEKETSHIMAVAFRSQWAHVIFAFLICFIAEIASGYLLGLANQFIYIPRLGLTSAPHLWIFPPEYALALLQFLRLAIPFIVLLLFYAKPLRPARTRTWIMWILAILTGSLTGNLAGWYFFVISYTGVVPFFYSQYAILLFSGGWLETSLAALVGILASSLKHNRYTPA